MSTHEVRVIRIAEIEAHPNADQLGLVRIEGFTAIVRLGDFKAGDLAAYIEPDYVVPDTEQFSFLQGHLRIKAKRLRGTWSQGLLIAAPAGAKEGDCVMERLGVVRYEPPIQSVRRVGRNGKPVYDGAEKPHKTLSWLPKYDLENWRKYRAALEAGEHVQISEKIHGANARYAWREGRMWCGSRLQWKQSGEPTRWQLFMRWLRAICVGMLPMLRRYWRPLPNMRTGNIWWRVLDTHGWIVDWCKAHPDCVLYGEVFGAVQDLKYGAKDDEVYFRAFDVMLPDGKWMDACDFGAALPAEHRVPILFDGPYCPVQTEELSRLKRSKLADHIAEGVVIKPLRERHDPRLGRVALKLVSDLYLERA